MSADNGIYILKTKDQYRVAHLQAIDNVRRSAIDGDWQSRRETSGKCVPTRVVELWGRCKYTRNEKKAFEIARKLEDSLPICEYGINIITYNKPWKYIVKDARAYAGKEIKYIKEHGKERQWDMEQLQKIADGSYFQSCAAGQNCPVKPSDPQIVSRPEDAG